MNIYIVVRKKQINKKNKNFLLRKKLNIKKER